MKRIAWILAVLLMLSAFVACSTGNGGEISETTTEPIADEPADVTTVPPSPDGGDREDVEVTDGETTDAKEEEEQPLLTVTSSDKKIIPKACYYWEGELGSGLGGAAMLPIIAESLPVLPYSEGMTLSPKDGGAVSHIKAYNTSYAQNGAVSGTDLSVLGALDRGVWYVVVGISWQNEEAGVMEGYEFAFTLIVDAPIFFYDGASFVFPYELFVAGNYYDAGEWNTESGSDVENALSSLASSVPSVSVSDKLEYMLTGSIDSSSLLIYSGEFQLADVDASDLAMLESSLRPGTWYIVVRVTWQENYIESDDRYELETYDYIVKLTIPENE